MREFPISRGRLVWSYGVTTVEERLETTFPRTLTSLWEAGFQEPHIFIDGVGRLTTDQEDMLKELCGREAGWTIRYPRVLVYSNWVLSMWELYLRNPNADRFALFQDDMVCYRNLREFLDRCKFPDNGYWNLYTAPSNQEIARGIGWYRSNQNGRGAVALIFSREIVVSLLTAQYLITTPQNRARAHKSVDGAISHSLRNAGYTEYVHNPSLIQHIGVESEVGTLVYLQAASFKGEGFNALNLL